MSIPKWYAGKFFVGAALCGRPFKEHPYKDAPSHIGVPLRLLQRLLTTIVAGVSEAESKTQAFTFLLNSATDRRGIEQSRQPA